MTYKRCLVTGTHKRITQSKPTSKPRIGPVLILGFPRSGTTALAYPFLKRNASFTNELNLFIGGQSRLGIYSLLVNLYPAFLTMPKVITYLRRRCANIDMFGYKGQINAVYDMLSSLRNTGVDISSLVTLWGASVTSVDFKPGEYDQCVWGDQSPGMITHPSFPDVLKYWPSAKIIYIQRDGRDAIASHIRLGWTNPGLESIWDAWVKAYYVSESIPGILKIRQETLLRDPVSVTKEINKFLNLDVLHSTDYNIFVKRGKGENPARPTDIPENARVVLNKLGYL